MDEKGNMNLKEVNLQFEFEKRNLEEYLSQKRAYEEGVSYFDAKHQSLPIDVHLKLRHEAGMAEVFRQKRELLKYSAHCYRQIELIFSLLFENKEFIENLDSLIHWDYWLNKHEEKKKNDWHSRIKVSLDNYNTGRSPFLNLNEKNKNWIFKSIFYFKPKSKNKILRESSRKITGGKKVYLNAFDVLHYFRNLASHNNIDNKSLSQKTSDKSERKYRENPHLIMESAYFQSYIDMIITQYERFVKEPEFLTSEMENPSSNIDDLPNSFWDNLPF